MIGATLGCRNSRGERAASPLVVPVLVVLIPVRPLALRAAVVHRLAARALPLRLGTAKGAEARRRPVIAELAASSEAAREAERARESSCHKRGFGPF